MRRGRVGQRGGRLAGKDRLGPLAPDPFAFRSRKLISGALAGNEPEASSLDDG